MIPQDLVLLVSYLNCKLRDEYASLADLCEDLELSEAELSEKLLRSGYRYEESGNKIVQIR